MNRLSAIIQNIQTKQSLSLVHLRAGEIILSSIVIDTPETVPYLRLGNKINVLFKESEVIIGKGDGHRLSLQNKLPGQVKSIESGDLLSRLVIETSAGPITSVITSKAVKELNIGPGSMVTAYVKTNEVMLSE